LDYNATTPCASEVVDAMLPYFRIQFGNPSSLHAIGRQAVHAVDKSRAHIAAAIGSLPDEVYFTSGATESNNMVLLGLADRPADRKRIVVSSIEHKSVLEPCKRLAERGFDVVQIPVTSAGVVDLHAAERIIDTNTLLVSVHGANNEIGTLQPIRSIADLAHSRGALLHCDASQMLGKVPVSVEDLAVDFASFSAHKVYGPKGMGLLYMRRGVSPSVIEPLFVGGGQQDEVRPGTLNVPGIVGLGEACRIAMSSLEEEMSRIRRLRDIFEDRLVDSNADLMFAATGAANIPGTLSVCFTGVPADALIAHARYVCVGTGSACTSGAPSPSHVHLACGFSREIARCFIRISLGRYTTEEEVVFAASALSESAKAIKRFEPANVRAAALAGGRDEGR